jgi:glucose-6-phosphate isomerase
MGWASYREQSLHDATTGLSLDLSALGVSRAELDELEPQLQAALQEMVELEAGALANPDEKRRVGHYWLRNADLAPSEALSQAIEAALVAVDEAVQIARQGHRRALVIGIGGSALGPMLVHHALREPGRTRPLHFLDNTDPAGMERTLQELAPTLEETLVVVISKSGGTKETRNGLAFMEQAYRARGMRFAEHAVAITGAGSELDKRAIRDGYLARLPMWDWVGGRTSVTSAVGLFPAAFCGIDSKAMLAGAAAMDRATRQPVVAKNLAAWLAAAWYLNRGRAMVVLPYSDPLQLMSRYLQQLVMESLGKRSDRNGRVVETGMTVYGNKGSTDQHAYVQQLLDGPDDFFVTFIHALEYPATAEVEPQVQIGDYLFGFMRGTRRALAERGRRSLSLTLPRIDAACVGGLIALYERAVGLYASMVNINAYHQPAVESGKRAAAAVLDLQRRLLAVLDADGATAPELAQRLGEADVELVFSLLRHLSTSGRVREHEAVEVWEHRFGAEGPAR